MSPIEQLYGLARERVKDLRGTWACITPGCGGEMDVRRSVLREDSEGVPEHVDDLVKCRSCLATVTHGGNLFVDWKREVYFRQENANRRATGLDWRSVDFVLDWPEEDVRLERLVALGYA